MKILCFLFYFKLMLPYFFSQLGKLKRIISFFCVHVCCLGIFLSSYIFFLLYFETFFFLVKREKVMCGNDEERKKNLSSYFVFLSVALNKKKFTKFSIHLFVIIASNNLKKVFSSITVFFLLHCSMPYFSSLSLSFTLQYTPSI